MTKKYKRALSILLAVALFFGMCSCGKQPVVNEAEPSVSAEPTSKPTATLEPATTSEPTATLEPVTTPEPSATSKPATTPEPTASPLQTIEIPDETWTGVTEGFTTLFEYDLDGDGQKETYIFGVAFNNLLHGQLITNERIGIQAGNQPNREPFPCVWKYAADSTIVVAEEFASLLLQSEIQLFCLTDASKTQPQVTKLNSNWQGGLRIRFTDDHHGIWMYGVSAVLDGEVLYAAATTTIAVSGRPEPTLDSLKTDSNPTTRSEPAETSKPTTTPESTIDLFLVEDNIVDSTNDIIIDIYAFIEECNKAHEAITRTTYSEEWYSTYGPDFHDTLDLVSKEEAEALLNTPQRGADSTCTKSNALKDVDLLFRVFKSFYGPYYFFGGDSAFDAAEQRIVAEIERGPDLLTLEQLSVTIIKNLDFVEDRHMGIGEYELCEYNQIATHDYYVKGLYFYEDDRGYYTIQHAKKWYLEKVGSDSNISEYFKITIDENGQLCYMLGLSATVVDSRLKISEISFVRGDMEVVLPIQWTEFTKRSIEPVDEDITITNNIPLLEIDFNLNGSTSGEEQEAQGDRIRQMGSAFLSQDIFILDANSGCGWQSLFETIDHSYVDLAMYRLSNTADYLGRWNMPWHVGSIGEYYTRLRNGRWGKNDTLVFAVQDKNNFSASEGSVADIRTIENVVLVGTATGGSAGPDGATNQHMKLPNTGLGVSFGATLSIVAGYTEEGFCLDPDIWVEPNDAVDAIYRLCEFYGIKNTADTSVLDKYQSPHGYE